MTGPGSEVQVFSLRPLPLWRELGSILFSPELTPPSRKAEAPAQIVTLAPRPSPRSRKDVLRAEDKMRKLEALLERIDSVLTPDAFKRDPVKAKELSRQRADLAKALASAEDEWLEMSAAAE